MTAQQKEKIFIHPKLMLLLSRDSHEFAKYDNVKQA
jgi:hypothetical protein